MKQREPNRVRPLNEPIDDPVLAEIVGRLVEAYQPLRIYLFGSVARGEGGPDNDYDLMVVVPDNAEAERRSSRLAYQRLLGAPGAADVLVSTQRNFERRLNVVASLPATILREGKLLYKNCLFSAESVSLNHLCVTDSQHSSSQVSDARTMPLLRTIEFNVDPILASPRLQACKPAL